MTGDVLMFDSKTEAKIREYEELRKDAQAGH